MKFRENASAGGSILATQEEEIRWIEFRSQPWANSLQDTISKIPSTKQDWESGSSAVPQKKKKKRKEI
jgi:hypothetical protein